MNNEILQTNEIIEPSQTDGQLLPALSPEVSIVSETMAERTVMLQNLEPLIGRKLYYALAEKLKNEQEALLQLFGLGQRQQRALAKYTFILDTAYFEQKLFETLI